MADALVLAASVGDDLWKRTRTMYMTNHQEPFMRLVASVQDRQLGATVDASNIADWKETLALLITYAGEDELPALAATLGSRLEAANDHAAATFCYVTGGSVAKAFATWSALCGGWAAGDMDTSSTLQGLIEKVRTHPLIA